MDNLEFKKFKKNIILKKVLVAFVQISLLILLLVIWQYLADSKLINTFIFSSPQKIIETIISLHEQQNLYYHILITVYETIISFGLGTILGVFIAIILWWNNFLYKVFDPYLTIINSLPKVALGPIIIIWSGANINSIIIMALLISVIVTIITIYNGFVSTDQNKINLLKSFKANKYQILKYVILPSSYSTIISSLKINISMSLIGLLPPVGENLNSNKYYSKYLSHYL